MCSTTSRLGASIAVSRMGSSAIAGTYPGLGGEVLEAGLVSDIERDAPDEVRGEAADQNHHQNRQTLPKSRRAVFQGERFDGLPAASP